MITLGWFGVKSAQDQREIHKHRIIALITQNLARLDESISELVKSYERKLNTLDSMTDYSTSALRKVVRSIPVVHQLLILDQRGKRIFPSHVSFTRPEYEFIRRTKPFIETFLKGSRRGKNERRNHRRRKRKALRSPQTFGTKKSSDYRPRPYKKSNKRKVTTRENGNIRIEQHLYANSSQENKTSKLVRAKIAKQKIQRQPIRNKPTDTESRVLALNSSTSNTPQLKEKRPNAELKNFSTSADHNADDSPIIKYDTPNTRPKSATTAQQDKSTSEKKWIKKSRTRFEVMPPEHYNSSNKPARKPQSTIVINKQNNSKSQVIVANTQQQPLRSVDKNKEKNSRPHNTKEPMKRARERGNRDVPQAGQRNPESSSAGLNYSSPSPSASPTKLHQQKSLSHKNIRTQKLTSTSSVKPSLQPQTKESVFQDLRGWSIGFRKNGINLIFSFRKSDGYLIAAEISRTRLIADITLLSPISKSQTKNITQSRITLTNARGDIISQWGRYEPEKNSKPLVSYGLAVPLNSWKLNYFSAKIDLNNTYSYAPFALGVSAVFIAVFGLAFYFYRESNRELTVASQRVTFVNQVSHELKTPLTNIRMYAELLEEDLEDSNDRTRSRMQVIINESQRLSRMIINVLNFARHQRKQLTIIRSKRVVDDIIHHVLDQLRPALQRLNIEVEFKANASQEIDVDTDILEQILHNLISNVEKYAATGQYLGIESCIINDTIQLTLSDKGPGIPRAMIHKIFEAFYRGNNQLAEGVSGTGIGLSISRELARLHGGDLELVNSQQGITFKLTLDSKAKRK